MALNWDGGVKLIRPIISPTYPYARWQDEGFTAPNDGSSAAARLRPLVTFGD